MPIRPGCARRDVRAGDAQKTLFTGVMRGEAFASVVRGARVERLPRIMGIDEGHAAHARDVGVDHKGLTQVEGRAVLCATAPTRLNKQHWASSQVM
jgi:hypothetical protein